MAYQETDIERAVRVAHMWSQPLGHVPHRRDPPDPLVEQTIMQRWLKMPVEDRAEIRKAMAFLNIPMQDLP